VPNTPRRRKLLLFIGSSVIFQAGLRAPSADVGCDIRVSDAQRRLFDSLALLNLTVHSIDPSGLVTLGPQTRAVPLAGSRDRMVPSSGFRRCRPKSARFCGECGDKRIATHARIAGLFMVRFSCAQTADEMKWREC
jgi:hypothetical protein